ncbi:hypothetical protein AB7211_13650 [Providencia rettgeri]
MADKNKGDQIRFHALYREGGQVKVETAENYKSLSENSISDTYSDLTKAQVRLKMGGLGQ